MPEATGEKISLVVRAKEFAKRHARKIAAVATIGLGAATGIGIGTAMTEQPQTDRAAEVAPISTELNFMDWYKLSREDQEAKIISLIGKDVVLNVNTSLLKLHHKLDGDGYKLLDLNIDIDKFPIPPASKDWSGHPVEVRISDGQYEKLKMIWPIDNFADIPVPEGTKLLFQATQLPRDSYSKGVTTQLAFITFTPPQTPATK